MSTIEYEVTDNEANCHEFKIQSESTNFNKKKDSIFGSLAILEQKHAAFEKVCPNTGDYIKSDPIEDSCIDDRPKGENDRSERVVRGGNFRSRKFAPYTQPPSFRREPCKWTKYDLSDVDASMMSERSNKAAAMSFLSSLKDQKKMQEDAEPIQGKVIFKKPTVSVTDSKQTSPSCSSAGKIILPEYDFGSKREKAKKIKTETVAIAACNRLQLSHLADLEDEGGDGDD